jgi:hypothetical protein
LDKAAAFITADWELRAEKANDYVSKNITDEGVWEGTEKGLSAAIMGVEVEG